MRAFVRSLALVVPFAFALGCRKEPEVSSAPSAVSGSLGSGSLGSGSLGSGSSGSGSGSAGAPAAPEVERATEGATQGAKKYRLDVAAPKCALGAECQAVVTLTATDGFHINDAYPYRFVAATGPTFELLGKDGAGPHVFSKAAGDFTKESATRAALTVRFRAKERGTVPLSGTYKLSVCSAETCLLETEPVSAKIDVN